MIVTEWDGMSEGVRDELRLAGLTDEGLAITVEGGTLAAVEHEQLD